MLPAPATAFNYDTLPSTTATSLRKQAAKIREGVKATTAAIIEVGRDLIAAKQNLEHNQFCEWVEAECVFSVRSAQNYMRAAEFAEGKNATVAFLQPATVYKLSAKSAPPAVVQEVIERAASGVLVSDRDVSAALDEARHQKREAERKQQQGSRKAVSKHTLAKREAQRRAYEAEEQKRQERFRVVALSIIDTIGEDHAQFLLDALGSNYFEIYEHLRREVSKLDADQPRTNGAEGIVQETEARAARAESKPKPKPKPKRKQSSAENGRDDHIVSDLGELAADRWTETH
jgi:Protein of unknown function (DUF3102)